MAKKITKSLIKKLIEQQLKKKLNEQTAATAAAERAASRKNAAAGIAAGATKAIRKGETGGMPDDPSGPSFFEVINQIPQGDCEQTRAILKQVIKPLIDNDPSSAWYGEIIEVLDISNQELGFNSDTMEDLSRRIDSILQKMQGFNIPGYVSGQISTNLLSPSLEEGKQPLKEVAVALSIYAAAIAASVWIYYASKSDDPEKPTEQEIKQMPSSDLSKAVAAILLNPGGTRPTTVYDIVATIVAFMTGCTGLISWIPRVPEKKDEDPDDKPDDADTGRKPGKGGNCMVFYAEAVRVTGMRNYRDATMLIQALLVASGESPIRGETKVSSLMDMELTRAAAIEAADNKEKIRNKIDAKQRRKLGIDGICGRGTMDAVRRMQKKIIDMGKDLGDYGPNRDGVDGIVGRKTMPYLEDFAFSKGDLDGGTFGAAGRPSPGNPPRNNVLNAPPAPGEPESLEESEFKQIREHFARWEKLWK